MVSPINTALSGLAAAGRRAEVSANNIANQSSTKSNVNGQTVDRPFAPQRVDRISQSAGGVIAEVRPQDPAFVQRQDPENPGQLQSFPNVDTAEELTNLKLASYDFKANLRVIQTQDDLNRNLLDILT